MSNPPPQTHPFAKLSWPVLTFQPLDLMVRLSGPHGRSSLLYAGTYTLRPRHPLTSHHSAASFPGNSSPLLLSSEYVQHHHRFLKPGCPHITRHHSKGCGRTHTMRKYNLPSLALFSTLTCAQVALGLLQPREQAGQLVNHHPQTLFRPPFQRRRVLYTGSIT